MVQGVMSQKCPLLVLTAAPGGRDFTVYASLVPRVTVAQAAAQVAKAMHAIARPSRDVRVFMKSPQYARASERVTRKGGSRGALSNGIKIPPAAAPTTPPPVPKSP